MTQPDRFAGIDPAELPILASMAESSTGTEDDEDDRDDETADENENSRRRSR